MIITFCGHSQFIRTEEYEQKILAFLEEKVGDNPADFYWEVTAPLTALPMIAARNIKPLTPAFRSYSLPRI